MDTIIEITIFRKKYFSDIQGDEVNQTKIGGRESQSSYLAGRLRQSRPESVSLGSAPEHDS